MKVGISPGMLFVRFLFGWWLSDYNSLTCNTGREEAGEVRRHEDSVTKNTIRINIKK